jgi:hypothetical protein
MLDAVFMLVAGFLGGTLGGGLAAGLLIYRFSRRCTSLEWAIGDLQQRASTFKGREMADKRWKKDEAFQQEMAQALQADAPRSRKYDNDPLG